MNRYYYTFGSNPAFPYGIDDYVEVTARTMHESTIAFRLKHPDRSEDCLNCAFIYTEDEFNQIRDKYYGNVSPVESLNTEGIIFTDRDEAIINYEMSGVGSLEEYASSLSDEKKDLFMEAVGLSSKEDDYDCIEME